MVKKGLFLWLAVLIILTMALLPVMTGCTKTTPTTTSPTATTQPTTTAPTTEVKTTTLKWLLTSTGYDETSWGWQTCQGAGWAREVEIATNGAIKFEYLVGAVNAPDMYDSLIAGAGDIMYNVILLWTGRFPAFEIMTVNEMFAYTGRPSKVAWELWESSPAIQDELKDVKILAGFATTPSPPGIGFATKDLVIDTIEKTKGVKMGQYGLWSTKRTNALGFTAVAVPNPEVYEAIQRGIVDGSFMDFDFLSNQNVGELVKYWHPISMLFCPFILGMNWDSWNKLPDDVKKTMEDLAVNIPDWADYYLMQDKIRIAKDWPNLVTVDVTDKQKWIDATNPVTQEYIAELTKKGIDGQGVYDQMMSLFKQYEKALTYDQLPAKLGGEIRRATDQ